MSKKSKIILICLAVAVIVIAAITIPLTLIKFNGNTRLAAPSQIEVFQSEDLIVFKTSKVKNAKEYTFIITMPDGSTKTIDSQTNILTMDFLGGSSSLKNMFKNAGLYSVQCYAVAENPENNSFKSVPETFERTVKLLAPRLEKDGKNFIWDKINHADAYKIIISSNSGTQTETVEGTNDEIQSISLLSLKSQFTLENDVLYSMTIVALSENEYYLTSLYSNQLQFYIN